MSEPHDGFITFLWSIIIVQMYCVYYVLCPIINTWIIKLDILFLSKENWKLLPSNQSL